MANVTVTPEKFELIDFDAGEIEAVCREVAHAAGLPPDIEVRVHIDEASMAARATARVEEGTVVVDATGGAFESQRKARVFDPDRGRSVLGMTMVRVADRLSPDFGDPPSDDDMSAALDTAWATYIEGRLARRGVISGRKQRRLYHFRVRFGFTDTVDEVFEALWSGDGLTWSDIEAMSARAAEARAGV